MYPTSRLLDRAVQQFPDRLAIVDGDLKLNYRQLGARVCRLANALRGLGLASGDRVAILDHNTHRYAETYYAAALAGVILLPLNSRLAAPEVEYILNDSGTRALLLSTAFLDILEQVRPRVSSLDLVIQLDGENREAGIHNYEALLREATESNTHREPDPDDIVQIYYTSGTTGNPKGTCLTNANVFYCGLDCVGTMDFHPSSVWLHSAPMFHLADAVAFWAVPMVGGVQVCVQFQPERILELIQTERVTITSLPATLIALIANHTDVSRYDLSSLTQIMYGGSPTPLGVLEKAEAFFRSDLLLHTYGITETSGLACCLPPRDHSLTASAGNVPRAASCGPPTHLIDLRVVDESDADCSVGTVGEVLFGGPKIMKGYWEKPDLTAEVLQNGWYRTGDMGYLDDTGHLYLVDRKKDMIITGAENVYSVEVENTISTHPGVLEVAVIGIPHPVWGEQVHAVVVRRNGFDKLSGEEVIGHCRGRIAGYKIPKSVEFADGPLPTTGPGKIAKRRLRDPYWSDERRQI